MRGGDKVGEGTMLDDKGRQHPVQKEMAASAGCLLLACKAGTLVVASHLGHEWRKMTMPKKPF